MSDFTVTITPPETTSITIGGGISPHNSTHAPNGSDSLESWYATTESLAYVSGQISTPEGTVLLTGDQNVSGIKNFSSRPTVNGSGVMLTGENGGTGYLTDYVQKTETGAFVSSNQTGQLTGAFYPLSSNPSAYLQGAVVRPSNTGNFVDTVSAQTINNLKTFNSGIIVGQNSVNGTGSSALGGSGNHVTGRNSVVIAGINNRVNAANSFIGGGHNNRVETSGSAVVGGWANIVESTAGVHNFIGGGVGNRVDNGNYNAILGGVNNSILEGQDKNAILGGEANALSNTSNCFTLGSYNTLFGASSTIENSFAFGYNASVSHSNAAVINEGLATTESSGERTIVIQFDSGIHLKGPTFFSSRPTFNGTGFLLSGEASSTPNVVFSTGDQPVSGTKNFSSRPQVSGVGIQTTGEYARFNLWDEFSGALYPFPRNDLNRSWNILKRLENEAGPSGATIWRSFPPWTGATPSGEDLTAYYNTGFWARQYDFSCVAFKNGRTGYPIATLISPRHALIAKHTNTTSGTKYAFFSTTETGYSWEPTAISITNLSGDSSIVTFDSDAPSQIKPASILGSLPNENWQYGSLTFARAFTIKDSTVLFDYLVGISSGTSFQSGSLILGHSPEIGAKFTGVHVGGDSSSPVFIPVDGNRLALVGVGSSPSDIAFVGDPVVQSGISLATSGYLIDTFSPQNKIQSILPTPNLVSELGSTGNPWTNVFSNSISGQTITASVLVGSTSKNFLNYTSLAYNGNRTISSGTSNLSYQPRTDSLVTLSGSFPTTTLFDFVITGSNVVTFTGVNTTLIMPHGSGFSGSGSVIDIRSVGSNMLMVSRQGSDTGLFYPSTNPSGYITSSALSSYATIDLATGASGHLQTQISAISASSGAFLTTGAGNNLYVSLTGDQDVSGSKDFQTRPTILDIPVLVSGDAVELIHLYGKNDEGMTVYKAQPVYIEGANGTNPLLKLASNTGERTSSKTIGLLAQNLLINEIGSVITEGILEGFDTSAASAGDPMWLGTSGNILYGTGNKPFGNNHQVYLGSVLRSNNTNGKVYVKVQNGYEIDELHNVYAQNASDKDALLYDSASGSWISRTISTGDVSGITDFALKSETGSFVTTSQTGSFSSPVVQVKYAEQTGHVSGLLSGDFRYASVPIPNVSGNLFFSVPITPSNTGSLIDINAFLLVSSSVGTQTTLMISRSGETNCRYQNTNLPSTVRNDYVTIHSANWREIAGTTGLINYEIRAVSNNSNIFLNRAASSSAYPTNNKSSILVQEIRV